MKDSHVVGKGIAGFLFENEKMKCFHQSDERQHTSGGAYAV